MEGINRKQRKYHTFSLPLIFAIISDISFQVVNKWSQIPKMRPLIVQKYVARPHLINDTKYDLRIYVLLTSLCPLRIFLYDEGNFDYCFTFDCLPIFDILRAALNPSITFFYYRISQIRFQCV